MLVSATAGASEESSGLDWTFGGFGTLSLVHTNEHQADFSSSILKASGAGYTREWSGDVDSRLGAQLGVRVNQQWSGVLQIITEQGLDNSYRPRVEWANIKYQATPEMSARIGRIALPMFLAADYRKVAYAFPWVRTPVEVYGSIPISSSDGIDFSYRWNNAELKNVTQVFYGGTDVRIGDGAHARARGISGVSHTIDYGALSLRASLLTTRLTIDVARTLFDGLRQFGPQGIALAERYQAQNKPAIGLSLGASYDPGNWFVMGEFGHLKTNSFLGNKNTLYASAGLRRGDWTPYLAYANVRVIGSNRDAGLTLDGLPPPLAGAAMALNAGLNGLLSSIAIQETRSIGARWDFKRNLALKLQYDRVTPNKGSSGMLINVQPDFQSGHSVNVVNVALDFVF